MSETRRTGCGCGKTTCCLCWEKTCSRTRRLDSRPRWDLSGRGTGMRSRCRAAQPDRTGTQTNLESPSLDPRLLVPRVRRCWGPDPGSRRGALCGAPEVGAHACTCTCVHVSVYVCACACICLVCTSVFVHVYECMFMHACVFMCVLVHVCMFFHVNMCVHCVVQGRGMGTCLYLWSFFCGPFSS